MARRSNSNLAEQVAHQVDFRLDQAFYAALVSTAKKVGLTRPNGKPRVAELIRVLVISALKANMTVKDRTAIAVYCNSVLILSGRLTSMLAELRTSIAQLASVVLPPPSKAAPALKKPYPATVVSVVLDDVLRMLLLSSPLRAELAQQQQAGQIPSRPALDTVLVRELLKEAWNSISYHQSVVVAYAARMKQVEANLQEAVGAGQEAIAAALEN